MTDERLRLIYDESVRKLDQQADVVEALRGRTSLLLGAGALSTSFLGPEAITSRGWEWEAVVAVLCLSVATLLVLAVLWPYRWTFSHDPEELLRVYVLGPKPRTTDGTHRWLAIKNHRLWLANRRILDRLFTCFQCATILVVISIVCWLAQLGG